jgi:hypothetical protein
MAFGVLAQQTAPERWQFIAFDQSFAEMPQQRWLLGIAGDRPVACELNQTCMKASGRSEFQKGSFRADHRRSQHQE